MLEDELDEDDDPVELLEGTVLLDEPEVPIEDPVALLEPVPPTELRPVPRVLVPSGFVPGALAVPDDDPTPLSLSSDLGCVLASGTGRT